MTCIYWFESTDQKLSPMQMNDYENEEDETINREKELSDEDWIKH